MRLPRPNNFQRRSWFLTDYAFFFLFAPRPGLEPGTIALTGRRSTIELSRNTISSLAKAEIFSSLVRVRRQTDIQSACGRRRDLEKRVRCSTGRQEKRRIVRIDREDNGLAVRGARCAGAGLRIRENERRARGRVRRFLVAVLVRNKTNIYGDTIGGCAYLDGETDRQLIFSSDAPVTENVSLPSFQVTGYG